MTWRRRVLAVAAACAAALGSAAPAFADTSEPAPGVSEISPGSNWELPDRLVLKLDDTWQRGRQVYVSDESNISVRSNAMLLELHALAALSGHTGPARQDARIPGLVRFFTTAPVYVTATKTKRATASFPHVPAWESVFRADSTRAILHPSADAIIAKALATAWRAREVTGLPLADSQRIQAVVRSVARGRWYKAPTRAENQINWNTDVYAANFEVNGDRSQLPDYRAHLKWFITHAHRQAYRYGTSNLSRGYGFHYLPQRGDAAANRIDTIEYANLVSSSLGFYNTAVRAGMRPLSAGEIAELKRWSRHILFGTWTHSGYPNWDTALGTARRHVAQYWAFALDSLVRSAVPGALLGTVNERRYVRYVAQRGLELFARIGWDGIGKLPPPTMFGAPNGFESGTKSPLVTPLRFAVLSASLDVRLPATVPRAFGNTYSHDSEMGRLAISTPAYNAAIVRPAGQNQGGLEPVRLFDAQQRPLTVLTAGSFYGPAPGIRLARGGSTILDDQPGTQLRGASIPGPVVAPGFKNNAGLFRTLTARGTIRRGTASISVATRFDQTSIETTYRVTRGTGQTLTLRIPVWGATSTIDLLKGLQLRGKRIARHGDGAVLVRGTTPDGGVMLIAFRGIPRQARVVVVAHPKSASAPKGARELRIRFRAKAHTTVRRRIAVVAGAPLR